MSLLKLRRTPESKRLASLRIIVAIVFIAAGLAKLLIPEFTTAFQEQLRTAELPIAKHLRLLVPTLELIIGYSLLIGKFTRFWSGVSITMMGVAIYVHLQITDPALFPFQPLIPIIPFTMIALLSILLIMGAGTWSKDLDIFEK
jgi:uncharacterized membrane protein YphA (DoxX/SURF4 family)